MLCTPGTEPEAGSASERPSTVTSVPGAHVYILRCDDDSLYTGWTVDLDKRLESHNAGNGAKYTRSRLPVSLFASIELHDKSAAMREEARVKALSRSEKLRLARSWPAPANPG
jgi:putative endonuclease